MLYRILLLGCLYSLASCDVVVMGSPGPKGEKGEPGLPGAIGSKGEKGDRGLNGDSGFQGSVGVDGVKGDQGAKGVSGPTGANGDPGAVGIKGPPGDIGEAGPQGSKGNDGPQGETGPQGVKGDKGFVGADGPLALGGPKGTSGVKGEKGQKGAEGEIGLPGLQGQQGEQGNPGQVDEDECLVDTSCPDKSFCTNKVLGFDCQCHTGYTYSGRLRRCDDVDECLNNNGLCEDKCTNTEGSYYCSCTGKGMQLSPLDNHTCIDKNECLDSKCGEGLVCVNTYGDSLCVDVMADTPTTPTPSGQVAKRSTSLLSTSMLIVLVIWCAFLTIVLIATVITLIMKKQNSITEKKYIAQSQMQSR